MEESDTNNESSSLSAAERAQCSILLIEPAANDCETLRGLLIGEGYGAVKDVADYSTAKRVLDERRFTHLIFSTQIPDITTSEFLPIVLAENPHLIPVVLSTKPELDEIFDVLVMGARGYLVKPVDRESINYALSMATNGDPISQSLLSGGDRNKTLVGILVNNLDKAAELLRQSEKYSASQQELPEILAALSQSVDLALTFAEGGEDQYLEALEDLLIQRSRGPASKLGRLRRRLAHRRKD